MTAQKKRIILLISVICFLLMACDFLIMPIGNNIEKNMSLFKVLTGTLFWLPLISGCVLQIILYSFYKKKSNNRKLTDCKFFGAISFFKNKLAAIFDLIFVISLVLFIIMLIFTDATGYFCYVLISLFSFSFCMHCILNGKMYNSSFYKNSK